MGLSEKAKKYLESRRKAFETEQYLPRDAKEPGVPLLRGYPFDKHISAKEKEKENLDILKNW
jgi:hypothetical protein